MSGSMSAGALHSDHVNYLILRYLQESGHENAAVAFYRDWRRPSAHRDPETFPFATNVRRNELVSIVQQGLRHDEILSGARNERRQFRFTIELDGSLENGNIASYPPNSGNRKGGLSVMAAPPDFPTPAPKRQRRSEGSESAHLNGDREAMELDAASASADAEDDGEPASPAMGSEIEADVIPERYDSMDVATQTEIKSGPKTTTMYWKIDKPGATVLHGIWNPDSDPKNSRTLLTVGESLCRFYTLPDSMEDTQQITHIDDQTLPSNSVITATAWHPNGRAAACAVDSINESAIGKPRLEQRILDHSMDHGSSVYASGLGLLLEEPGIAICLRYSPDGAHLLVVRTNLKRGLVQLWETVRGDVGHPHKPSQPIAWHIFEHQVFDACWIGSDTFLVSGGAGLSTMYRLDVSRPIPNGFDKENVGSQGLSEQRTEIVGLKDKLDKLRFDLNLGIAVFASSETRKLFTTSIAQSGGDLSTHTTGSPLHLPGQLTALAFQPTQTPGDVAKAEGEKSNLLAAAFDEGFCVVYRVTSRSASEATCLEIVSLELKEGSALALAWSPDGKFLAVGGADLVQLWHTDVFDKEVSASTDPLITWRPDSTATGPTLANGVLNGDGQKSSEILEPSLSWSADGESLAFAMDRQLAIIRFRPPLVSPKMDSLPHINGHGDSDGHDVPSP